MENHSNDGVGLLWQEVLDIKHISLPMEKFILTFKYISFRLFEQQTDMATKRIF